MKIYEIMEYRNCDEHYSWGVYSTEENARLYLKYMRWDDNDDFHPSFNNDGRSTFIINESNDDPVFD